MKILVVGGFEIFKTAHYQNSFTLCKHLQYAYTLWDFCI
jgi:hypothetical protein